MAAGRGGFRFCIFYLPSQNPEYWACWVSSGETTRTLSLLAAISVAALLAFAPVFQAEYGFLDDYAVVAVESSPWYTLQAQIRLGRPVTGVLMELGFGYADETPRFALLRGFSVASLLLFMLMVFRFLRDSGAGELGAAVAAFGMILLPPFQIFAAWAVCFPFMLGALLSFSAGGQAARAALAIDVNGVDRRCVFGCVVLSLKMAVACMIYQPAAMLFWVSAGWILVSAPGLDLRRYFRSCAMGLMPGIIGVAAGFLVFRAGVHFLGHHSPGRGGLTTEPIEKLVWFFTDALPLSLRLQAVGYGVSPLLLVFLAGAGVLLCRWYQLSPRLFPLRLLTAFGVLLLAYLPNLLSAESWASNRSLVAVSAWVWLLAMGGAAPGFRWMVDRLGIAEGRWQMPAFAVLVATMAVFGHQQVLRGFVLPQTIEWAQLVGFVERMPLDEFPERRLVVRKSHWSMPPRMPVRDEFFMPSGVSDWGAAGMVRMAIARGRADADEWQFAVVEWDDVGTEADIDLGMFVPRTY